MHASAELHGEEDGTVPATFQIINMVKTFLLYIVKSIDAVLLDRLEAITVTAKATHARIG